MHAIKTLNHERWLGLALALVATAWSVLAQDAAPVPDGTAAAPPPSAPPQRSAADLQKLAEPIALYPDPLISIVLPAAVYPVEIVQAARFVRNTNNIPKIDDQPWDENVKSVAKFPQVIAMMDSNLTWTVDLGEAFVDQQKELMDAIQTLRGLAQKAGTLQTTPQQTVYVTNVVIMQTNVTQVTEVTKEIVQIIPASPSVVYVPTYPPYVYYPPPAYVYNPLAPLVTFGAAVAVGAIIANNCNWYHGGVYVGHGGAAVWGGSSYNRNVNVNNYNNFNVNNSRNANINNSGNISGSGNRPSQSPGQGNRPGQSPGQGNRPTQLPADANRPGQGAGQGNRPTQQPAQKWQPDQNRRAASGGASASTREARGWSSGQGGAGNAGTRPSTGNVGARPSTGMPSSGSAGARPSTGNVGGTPSGGNYSRPSTGTASGSRPTAAPTTSSSQNRSSSSASRGSSSSSAFSGAGSSGSSARSSSSRGSSSRSSGGSRGGGGGGGRGGGRR